MTRKESVEVGNELEMNLAMMFLEGIESLENFQFDGAMLPLKPPRGRLQNDVLSMFL